MKRAACLLLAILAASPTWGWEVGLHQESGASVQLQTVQALGYWGSYQLSTGGVSTLGLDWDRTLGIRAGFGYRMVSTSPVVSSTVYPGYEGWGWVVAVDWLPLRVDRWGALWAAGLTLAGAGESMELPGLYRSFRLPSGTIAALGEVTPPGTQGLSFRLRLPASVDHRPGFLLSWRLGVEVAVAFHGVGWSSP